MSKSANYVSRFTFHASRMAGVTGLILLLLIILTIPIFDRDVHAEGLKIAIDTNSVKNADMSVALQILFLLTLLSLAPALLMMVTSFTRIVVVLSFLRQGLGTQQMPPGQIMIGLSLFLTLAVMAPVWHKIDTNALKPYMAGTLPREEALNEAFKPIRDFMFKQTGEKDLALMVSFTQSTKPKNRSEIPTHALIPAFMMSELKTAFQIGFLISIPFLIIDMLVASALMSMGMMMLPPMMISLPLKLLLFVLADGWNLIVGSLISSFR